MEAGKSAQPTPRSVEVASGWRDPQGLPLSLSGIPPLTATGTLSIEVLEVNDHAPSLFPTTGLLCRGGAGLVLSATDEDLAPHAGPFRFHLGPSSAHNWTLSYPNGNWVSWVPRVMGEGTLINPGFGAGWTGLPGRGSSPQSTLLCNFQWGELASGPAGACRAPDWGVWGVISGSLDFAGHQTGGIRGLKI